MNTQVIQTRTEQSNRDRLYFVLMIVTLMCMLLLAVSALAQTPRTISYQGSIVSNGQVINGDHNLHIALYDSANASASVYQEDQRITVHNGIFDVQIGSIVPLPLTMRFDRTYYLGISIDGSPELQPRTQLTSVPYALNALVAQSAESLTSNARGVVTSINELDGALRLIGDSTMSITQSGNEITIHARSLAAIGIQSLSSPDKTLLITSPKGPQTSVDVADNAITTAKLANGAVTPAKIARSGATKGQILKWNGTLWSVENDSVNTYTAGPGIAIANNTISNTSQLPPGTTPNSTIRWNGMEWTENSQLTSDANGNTKVNGTTTLGSGIGATGITMKPGSGSVQVVGWDSGFVVSSASGVLSRVKLSAGPGIQFTTFADTLRISNTGSAGWLLQGNGGTTAGTNFIGTTDNQPFEIHVNENGTVGFGNKRVMRFEPNANSANIIAGSPFNGVTSGYGGTISGGGLGSQANRVTGDFGTVSGGYNNTAANEGTVAGGEGNSAGIAAHVGGGIGNRSTGYQSAVSGGRINYASGSESTVGGGEGNTASASGATIAGGYANAATGGSSAVGGGNVDSANSLASTVSGGLWNTANGAYSAIPGGDSLRIGASSFGMNVPGISPIATRIDLTGFSNLAYFGNMDLWLGNTDNAARGLRFYAPSLSTSYLSRAYSSFRSGVQTSIIDYTLPISQPNANQILVASSVAGSGPYSVATSWMDAGAFAWGLTGNSGTTVGTNYLGTQDNQPFEIHIYNGDGSYRGSKRVLRFEPENASPNIIAGFQYNSVASGVNGATISGGGSSGDENQVGSDYGTVAGGRLNRINSGAFATISGGAYGAINSNSDYSFIGGGNGNTIASAKYATIAGGIANSIYGTFSAIPGGDSLTLGTSSFGANVPGSSAQASVLNLTSFSNLAYFGNMDLWLGNTDNAARALRFYAPSSSTAYSSRPYSAFLAGSQTATINYTLPTSQPSSNQVMTATGISGTGPYSVTLGWANSNGNTAWNLTGNSGTMAGTNFLGTSDNNAFEIHVYHDDGGNAGDGRVMRFEPQTNSPNIIGGYHGNTVLSTLHPGTSQGVTIAGGGIQGNGLNIAYGSYSVIGGGASNRVDYAGTVAGGLADSAGYGAAIGGGDNNFAALHSVIAGGSANYAYAEAAAITGGIRNQAGYTSAIAGGTDLKVGSGSFGYNGGSGLTAYSTDLSSFNNLAYFGNVDLWIGNRDNTSHALRFYAPNSSATYTGAHFSSLKAATQSTDVQYTLPTSQPTATQVLSASSVTGSGPYNVQLSWTNNGGTAWDLTGNSGTTAGTNFLGTTDNQPFEIHLNDNDATANRGDKRVMRYEPNASSPNIIGGYQGNSIASGTVGAIVAGGGLVGVVNSITGGIYSTISGGAGNTINGGGYSVISGGSSNTVALSYSAVGGGFLNTITDNYGAIAGGNSNAISSTYSFIGSGSHNSTSGICSAIAGGLQNSILGRFSAIAGGDSLTIGSNSFGMSVQSSTTAHAITDVSTFSNIAYLGNMDLWLGNTDNIARALRFYAPSTSTSYSSRVYSAFLAGSQSATINYTLPTSQPSANQVLAASSVSGSGPYTVTMNWTDAMTAATGVLYGPTSQQATLNSRTTPLFNVAYNSNAASGNAAGALITSSAGASGNYDATGLTIAADGSGSGRTIGLAVSASGSADTVRAIDATGHINIDYGSSYEIGGLPFLWGNSENIYLGNASQAWENRANITGNDNIIMGFAGNVTSGYGNVMIGPWSANALQDGSDNTAVGAEAGHGTSSGTMNSYFGQASAWNCNGDSNAFFGAMSGYASTGSYNSYFGTYAVGHINPSSPGSNNASFGFASGFNLTTGNNNTLLGTRAANTLTTGSGNTTLGAGSDVLTSSLSNTTAIGYLAAVNASNSLVLGAINGVNNSTYDAKVGIGTTTPLQKLNVENGNILLSRTGSNASDTLQFQGTSTGKTNFVAGSQGSTNITYTLPVSSPSATGNLLLASSGSSSAMSWSSSLIWDNTNTHLGINTTSPAHPLHSVNSGTTDEIAAVFGNASATTTNQSIALWGSASNTSGSNTGTLAVLATGNGNAIAGQTNIALQINDGEFSMGRTTESPNVGNTVEAAGGGTAYSQQGPSGMIELSLGASGDLATSAPTANVMQNLGSITINNRYCQTGSIVLVNVAGMIDDGSAPDPRDAGFIVNTESTSSGSFVLRIKMVPSSTNATNYSTNDKVRIGYMIVNKSK
jgi:hypothetical protein